MSRRGTEVDVLVSGAGMVGLTVALAAARAGFSVALVDAREPAPWAAGQEVDLRVSALSRATQRVLERLGVWEYIAGRRAGPVEAIAVWDGLSEASVAFSAADMGERHLAHIVENSLVQTALWEALGAEETARRYVPAAVEALDPGSGRVGVRLG
ncbi:FAD-binding protein, partial [Ectothiorhodospiraceae bacterium WFHF3C12]|nr:FAD-binding protein [Ectothiorhodospiraceae bacterium WFHF3C12]